MLNLSFPACSIHQQQSEVTVQDWLCHLSLCQNDNFCCFHNSSSCSAGRHACQGWTLDWESVMPTFGCWLASTTSEVGWCGIAWTLSLNRVFVSLGPLVAPQRCSLSCSSSIGIGAHKAPYKYSTKIWNLKFNIRESKWHYFFHEGNVQDSERCWY